MSILKKLYKCLYFPAKINRKKHINNARKRINNNNFSIISCNCMAGIIYHNLGEKFLSPTINTMIPSDSFVKFISNIDYYLGQQLEFIDAPVYLNGEKVNCPVANIDDVVVYFTHYNTREDAEEKWESRKTRINYDNMYVVFNDRDGVTKEMVKQLDVSKFKNVVMFTAKDEFDLPFCFRLSEKDISNINLKNNVTGLRIFEEKFDYVSFLNSGNDPAENFRI